MTDCYRDDGDVLTAGGLASRWAFARSLFLACIGLAVLGVVSPVYADPSAMVGGSGGARFRIECPSDSFIFGFDIRYGSVIDQLKPACARVTDGKFTDKISKPSWTGGHGGSVANVFCPPYQGLAGLDVYVNPDGLVRRFNMMCYLPGDGKVSVIASPEGGAADYNAWAHCPPGQFVNGIFGRSGLYVDALGVLCADLPKSSAAAPIDPRTAFESLVAGPTAEHCQVAMHQCRQRIQAQVGGQPGAAESLIAVQCTPFFQECVARVAAVNGTVRTVRQPTNLYYEREGEFTGIVLETGQKVTTVDACGNDWCKLSNPEGWMWGGDLT